MTRTRVGGLLVGVGTVVLVLSAAADWIGLGGEGNAFGWKQTVGVIVGALVIGAGAVLVFRRRGA
jgi:hypothetical protein